MTQALPFSRRDFCSRARVFHPTMFSNAFPLAPFLPCAHPGRKQKGKRNAERRVVKPALAARGALCGARSPLGVPLRLWPGRQLVPKARHQAMLPRSSPERSILYGRLNREAETLRLSTGITRAGKTNDCPRTASTSHAGRCAGRMMPDAARERVTSPPAGTALAPSQGVSSRRTSLRKARWSSFSSAGGENPRNSGGHCHPIDSTKNHPALFVRFATPQLWHAALIGLIRT